ncbi:MAG: HAD-IA family hydrolase [Eubacteriales bacterium]|nr:HAD-IA family hydrolase [Eubacteriales bacterium]
MNELKLVEATLEYAGQLWQFRKEVFEHDPDDGNRFAGCMSIESASSAEKWIKMCQMRKSEATCKQAGVDVPSTTYFAIRISDNKLVGVIDLRHHINHPILGTWGGNCGYTVRPSERGHGYAKEMLRLNLQNAKALGIKKVLVTCYHSNKESEKVIRANGGVYEKTVVVDGIKIQRFWINIVSNIKWIFFDIGSTLVDESAVYEDRISEITRSYHININDFIAKVKLRAQTNSKPIISVAADYGAKIPAWRHDLEILYPDAKEVLQKLRQTYKLGVIANQDYGTEKRLVNFGIRSYIDLVIASAEEGVEKPDLRIFQLALDRADCKPEEAVMVGDRLDNDIIPANKIGMKTVWIKQGYGGLSKPHSGEEQPDHTVDSLNELIHLFIS